jgi:hypothetical protein
VPFLFLMESEREINRTVNDGNTKLIDKILSEKLFISKKMTNFAVPKTKCYHLILKFATVDKVNNDTNKLLEEERQFSSIMYMELRRAGYTTSYHQCGEEFCDYLVSRGGKVVKAIQVSFCLSDTAVRERYIRGLLLTMETFGLKEGFVYTKGENERLSFGERTIFLLPFKDWKV